MLVQISLGPKIERVDACVKADTLVSSLAELVAWFFLIYGTFECEPVDDRNDRRSETNHVKMAVGGEFVRCSVSFHQHIPPAMPHFLF
jgi:hypothetical protein